MPERLKTSKMEAWLTAEIANAHSQAISESRRAELAAYLARLGRFEESLELLAALRRRNESHRRVEVSIRIHFAEGLLSYFSSDGVSASDGVQRAHALSVATRHYDLQALCAAWLAQWDYTKVDIKALRRHVVESLNLATKNNHSSRSRANLVVAQVLHLAGRFDLARPWYDRARIHATAGFDGATIGALMHNMSWQRMLVLRQDVLTRISHAELTNNVLVNAESTNHFNEIIGDSSWRRLTPILKAQILSLKGDAAGAIALYEDNFYENQIPNRWQSNLLADMAWCYIVIGRLEDAQNCAEKSIKGMASDTQIDDLAATHSRLSQLYKELGYYSQSEHHSLLATKLWTQFSAILADAVSDLSSFDENGKNIG